MEGHLLYDGEVFMNEEVCVNHGDLDEEQDQNVKQQVKVKINQRDEDLNDMTQLKQNKCRNKQSTNNNQSIQFQPTGSNQNSQFQPTGSNKNDKDTQNAVQNPETVQEDIKGKNCDEIYEQLEILKKNYNQENIIQKIQNKSSFKNHLDQIEYYRYQNILIDNSKKYYQQIQNKQMQGQLQSDQCMCITKVSDFDQTQRIISFRGVEGSVKNTNSSDLTIGRQQYIQQQIDGKLVIIKPNDITPSADETDTDISRMHCKIVYRTYIYKDQMPDGGFSSFVKIFEGIEKTFNKKAKEAKESNLKFLIKYKSLYNICKSILKLGFILPILKKFIVPEQTAYLVDFKSQNGTKILIHHKQYTRIYSHMIIAVGVNSLIYFEQINDFKYMNAFEKVIVNCIYDQIRLNYEIEKGKWNLEVNTCYYGLDEEVEESEIFNIIKLVTHDFQKKSIKENIPFENYFFQYINKKAVKKKILQFVMKAQQEYQLKNKNQDIKAQLFSQYRPYIRCLVKLDDSTPHQIKPYYLFYNHNAPNRIFKVGRLDTNHIQIRFRYVSRKNTEIIYKDNHWLIRDGYDDTNKQRKASTEKTWINLTGLNNQPELMQPDIQCISKIFREKTFNEEFGPYPIKNNDIIMCGKSQKYKIEYLYNYHNQQNSDYLDQKQY
ncbi:hypothetical protein ABPG74_015511 [Tetrahymena malaccensis]